MNLHSNSAVFILFGLFAGTARRRPDTFTAIPRAVVVSVIALGVLAACETAAERQGAHNAEINREAGAEVNRICSLPEGQRELELKKIKDQSGVVLYCGSK